MNQSKKPVGLWQNSSVDANRGEKVIKEKKAIDLTVLLNTINQAQEGSKAKLFEPTAVRILQSQLNHTSRLQEKKPNNIDTIQKCVGVVRTNWYNRMNNLVSFIYGTAFLVAENVLMTCTHNVFSASRKIFADQLIFVPNVDKGSIMAKYSKARRVKGNLCQSVYSIFDLDLRWQLKNQVQFQTNPTKYEICLIALDSCPHSQTLTQYIPIGRWKYDLQNPQTLAIFGYPSDSYKNITNFKDINVQRHERRGVSYSIQSYQTKNTDKEDWYKDSTLNYKINTQIGFSGSPILALGKDNNYYAVGIHTHRGKQYFKYNYNSGVFFNDFMNTIKCLVAKMSAKLGEEPNIIYKQCTQIANVEKKDEMPLVIQEESEEDCSYSKQSQKAISQVSGYSSFKQRSQDDDANSAMQGSFAGDAASNDGSKSEVNDDDNDSLNSQMSDLDGIYEYFTLIREPFDSCQSTPTLCISSIYQSPLLLGNDLMASSRLSTGIGEGEERDEDVGEEV